MAQPLSFLQRPFTRAFLGTILVLAAGPLGAHAQEDERGLEQGIERLGKTLPRTPGEFRDAGWAVAVAKAAREIEEAAARVGTAPRNADLEEVLQRVQRLLAGIDQVARLVDDLFALRKEFVKELPSEQRVAVLRNYLRVLAQLIDLSGRLRYELQETLNYAAFRVAGHQAMREKLIEMLVQHNSSIGAEVMAWILFDPPANAANGAVPASAAAKHRVLQLIARTGNIEVIPLLARFVREEKRYPRLVLAAADTLRQVGFPQDLQPGDTDEQSRPPMTAALLLPIIQQLPADSLDEESARLRDDLSKWLEARKDLGLAGDTYRFGTCEVRPGDWMLMRNPSPYNLGTDLSPGLFTHVGVVTVEKGTDGRRRMVVVDLPERGTHIRAVNIDVFIRQTRHYLFLRHPDARAARTMADVASSLIGNESVFDLNFRIDPVVALKGQPKKGKVIKTYCAGLLLVVGQETDMERSRIFPVHEQVAGGKMARNLKELGMAFGDHFVSPTGPLFSQEFTIVGRRPPMYAPAAEIEEAIYDRFAECMSKYDLSAFRDTFQDIRLTLAEASKDNPAFARLLGQLNNVNPAMDLVAAAKAAAMVENLDRAAYGNSKQYTDAFFALTCGPFERLMGEGHSREDIQRYQMLRQRHGGLFRQLVAGRINPRGVRKALIAYYVRQGSAEIEKRFKIEAGGNGS